MTKNFLASLLTFAVSGAMGASVHGAFTDKANRDVITVTAWAAYTMQITASTTNPSKASSTVVDMANWRRVGDTMEISYSYGHTSNSGASAGSGTYLFSLPSGYSIDTTKTAVGSSSIASSAVGAASAYVSGRAYGYVWPYDSTHLALAVTDSSANFGTISNSFGSLSGNTASFQFLAKVAISGWSTR